MDDTACWDARRGIFHTRKGGWVIGEAVYNHGYSMMDDLVGHCSFFQVLLLNVTGRLPERRLADWLEATFICLSWPDPRIWCNQVGALAGSARTSPAAAVAAGCLAADSRLYGPGVLEAATAFIVAALDRQRAGWTAERIVADALARLPGQGRPVLVGYARPIATGDERVAAMARVAHELGYPDGPHLQLAWSIDAVLGRDHDEGINLAGYVAAFLSDQGYQGHEIARIYSAWVNSGVHACYAEARDRPADTFLPMRCDDVEYCGIPPRPLPSGC
ncbi:MAG: hypothetical protein AB1899_04000 [Pseudomonadota bacterium]